MLVDTGVGPAGLWGWKAESEEGLLPALAAAGVTPDAVDVVFLTHLHVDHVGWNTDREGRPSSRRAFVTHRDGLELVAPSPRAHRADGLPVTFEELDGETTIADGVVAFPLPGHLPATWDCGSSRRRASVLIADTAVTPMLLNEPEASTLRRRCRRTAPTTSARARCPSSATRTSLVVCGH